MNDLALAKLQTLSLDNNLPHAWLFVGAESSNKLLVATKFSQWLLCADKQADQACGSCKQCNLFIVGNHPDFLKITNQEETASILLEDIRSLNDFICGKPQLSSKKIILLFPADKMNRQVSNSLLKSLEEPGDDTLLLLLTTHVDLLLKTIVSRCQILNFGTDTNIGMVSQQQTQELIQDLYNLLVTKSVTTLQLVDKWIKQWPNEVLYWFELGLADLIKCRYTRDPGLLKYGDLYSQQVAINNKVSANKLWAMLERLKQAKLWFGTNNKPNLQLILENILLV